MQSGDVTFGTFRASRSSRQLTGPNGQVELGARSFDILMTLLANPKDVISKDQLLAAAWPGVVVEENTLQVHMSALRKALPGDWIVTVHGRGYRYAGPEPAAAPVAKPMTFIRKPIIVVLPFENQSGDPGQQFFSDGVTEDIGDRLTRFRSFTVIGQHTASLYRGESPDVVAIRQKLGADFVVSGSIRRAGGVVRIAARLIDAASDAIVWADRYDRPLTDIFAVQDELSSRVAATVANRLEIELASRAAAGVSTSFESYEWILKGDWHFNQLTMAETDAAARCYAKALDLDPKNAEAMGSLAMCLTSGWLFEFSRPRLEQGIAMAERGCAADPAESMSHTVLGLGLAWSVGLAPAEKPLRRAIENNPDCWLSLSNLSLYATYQGQSGDARSYLDRARVVNPVAPAWLHEFEGISHIPEERFAEAVPGIEAMPEGDWDGMYLLACYGHLGEAEKARNYLARYEGRPLPDFLMAAENEPYADRAVNRLLAEGIRKSLSFGG